MKVFSEESTRRVLSPWGAEVKKRLIDRSLKQDDLVKTLRGRGHDINKSALSNLLYGIGASNRKAEIEAINEVLEIPYSEANKVGA